MATKVRQIASKFQTGRKEKAQDISRCLKKDQRTEGILYFHPEGWGSNSSAVCSPSALLCLAVSHRHNSQDNFPFSGSCQCLAESFCSALLLISHIPQRSLSLFLSLSFSSSFSFLFPPPPQTWIISKSTPEARCRSERARGWCYCAGRRRPREVSPPGLRLSLLLKTIPA